MSADVKSYIMTTYACQAALHLEMKKVDLMNDVSAALIRRPGPGQRQSPRSYFVLLGQPDKRAVSISLEPSLILSHQFCHTPVNHTYSCLLTTGTFARVCRERRATVRGDSRERQINLRSGR